MKIELIKETKWNGDVIYSVEVDGKYVSNSIALNEENAQKIFNHISENGGIDPKKEVIKETTI